MSLHRLYVVAGLSTLFLIVTFLVIGSLEPAHAQCESGAGCEETVLPTATPVRTDCPPGSHPVGLRDCEVDGTGGLPAPLFSSKNGLISPLVDFNFDGTALVINGSIQDPTGVTFNRRTEGNVQICGGDSINNDTNYRAYIIANATNQAHTVAISVTRDSGSLQPVLHLYDNSFDPATPADNCIKVDEGDGTTAQINNFTWDSDEQFIVVVTGFSNFFDEGSFTLTITPIGSEQEPNDDVATARQITPNIDWVTAEISGTGDVDYYRFEGVDGQRVWIYVRTDQSTNSQDSFVELRNGLDLIVAAGVSIDDNDGGQSGDSSTIAGFTLLETRPYYVRVTEQGDDDTITPYYLYVYLSDQNTIIEDEPNNNIFTATPYDNDGGLTYHLPPQIFQGHQNNLANGEDLFEFTVPLSSVIFTSLDTDADDNTTEFTGTLSLYDMAGTQVLSVASGDSSPIGEALSYGQTAGVTVTTNVWYASVISDGDGINLPYDLLVGYSPTEQGDVTYSMDVVNKFIPDNGTPVTSTLVSGNFCMNNLDVWLDLDHDNLDDLDVSLEGPDGTTVDLFTDRGGNENSLSITLDDEGGLAPLPDNGVDAPNARIGGRYQTENTTLHEFYRTSGLGQWTLTIVDDTNGNNDDPGNIDKLNNWALIMHCSSLKHVYLPIVLKHN